MLSSLSRGSTSEKLRWIFNLYDINGDGFITKQELLTIVRAVYRMLGDFTKPLVYSNTVQEHVDKIFFVSLNFPIEWLIIIFTSQSLGVNFFLKLFFFFIQQQMDTNHDGVITFEEFSQWCLRVSDDQFAQPMWLIISYSLSTGRLYITKFNDVWYNFHVNLWQWSTWWKIMDDPRFTSSAYRTSAFTFFVIYKFILQNWFFRLSLHFHPQSLKCDQLVNEQKLEKFSISVNGNYKEAMEWHGTILVNDWFRMI